MYRYEIGDKIYHQRELVIGQVSELLRVLRGVSIPADADTLADTLGIVTAVGERLPEALAAILIEEGTSLRGRDLNRLADTLAETVTPDQAMRIIEDFLGCNPVSSLLERLTGLGQKLATTMTAGSPGSPSGVPAGTSPGGTGLSGA